MKRLFARVAASPTKGEDRVKITSTAGYSGLVYVARLVKSSGRFGKRRYLIHRSRIREELIDPATH